MFRSRRQNAGSRQFARSRRITGGLLVACVVCAVIVFGKGVGVVKAVKGAPERESDPGPVPRGEVGAWIASVLGVLQGAAEGGSTSKTSGEGVGQLMRFGVVEGYEDGSLKVERAATVGEFVVMLGRAIGEAGCKPTGNVQASIPLWGRESLRLLGRRAFGETGWFTARWGEAIKRSDVLKLTAQAATLVGRGFETIGRVEKVLVDVVLLRTAHGLQQIRLTHASAVGINGTSSDRGTLDVVRGAAGGFRVAKGKEVLRADVRVAEEVGIIYELDRYAGVLVLKRFGDGKMLRLDCSCWRSVRDGGWGGLGSVERGDRVYLRLGPSGKAVELAMVYKMNVGGRVGSVFEDEGRFEVRTVEHGTLRLRSSERTVWYFNGAEADRVNLREGDIILASSRGDEALWVEVFRGGSPKM